jgi:predicted NUDIX family phosphoesterase
MATIQIKGCKEPVEVRNNKKEKVYIKLFNSEIGEVGQLQIDALSVIKIDPVKYSFVDYIETPW